MSADITLRDVEHVAVAADMVIATCENTITEKMLDDLGVRVLTSDPYQLIGALAALCSVALSDRDHRAILAEMVEYLSGQVK